MFILQLNCIQQPTSEESGVSVFNDATLAVLFDGPIAFDGYLAVLDVELLQTATVVGDALHASVRDEVAAADAELLEVRATLREGSQPRVADVAFADVEGPQPRAGTRQHGDGVVGDGLAAAGVQIPQLVAAPCHHLEARVRDLVALGHRQVAQRRTQLRQLVQTEVRHLRAVGHTQLTQH